jgi:hypothetical protein
MRDPAYDGKSVWYSIGDFGPDQHGGILRANARGEVTDVRIVKAYEDRYKGYKKMVGALKIGEQEIRRYAEYLFAACRADIHQYYHMPWIAHRRELPSRLCDLSHLRVTSFNTVEDYQKSQEMFAHETRQS